MSTHNDETEILIGRLVDNQASDDDRRRFQSWADADPNLWRRLALRQQDMAALASHVEPHLRAADEIELPASAGPAVSRMTIRVASWGLAISGWAAMVALALVWSANTGRPTGIQTPPRAVPTAANPTELTPDEHLRLYEQAGFVIGEMPPTLLEVEQLRDGRKAVRYIRRIEEVLFLPPDQDVPVDDSGNLTKPPSELRGDAPEAARPH
ncbi:MAG TPA: hypothetical protein VGQ19_01345 [Burkholderiales bacterium]|nr:hypothetical protein [Burkholderiales bacterium]